MLAGGGERVVGSQELAFLMSHGSWCDFRVVGKIGVVVFRDADVSTVMRCSTISLNRTARFEDVLSMPEVMMVALAPVHENWDP